MTTPAAPPPKDDRAKHTFFREYKAKSDWVKELIKRRIAALEEKLQNENIME